MKKLIFTDDNGCLCIVCPAPKESIELVRGPMTEEEYEAHVIAKSVPQGKTYSFIEDTDIPTSRVFRNAWTENNPGKAIDVDMTKARDIQKDRLRQLRQPKLEALDVEALRAIEEGRDTTTIAAKKTTLRDITNLCDAPGITDPDTLANIGIQEIKDV